MPLEQSRFLYQVLLLSVFLISETLYPFFSARTGRFRHGVLNLSFGIMNGLLGILFLNAVVVVLLDRTQNSGWGLLNQIELPAVWEFVLAFILFDFWMYAWHRMNHRLIFLWRFHQVHHSDKMMDTTTAFRFHPAEILLSVGARILVLFILGMTFAQLLIYEWVLQTVILFHHSNVSLPAKLDRVLRWVIVSPNMHRVHHSEIKQETDSNYSSVFSCWDRLFGSFRACDYSKIQFGLHQVSTGDSQNVIKIIRSPFS